MTNRSLSWTIKVDLADDAERPLLGLARQAKRTEDATERAAKATAKAYGQSSQQVKVSLKGTGAELGQVQIKAKRTGDEFARLTADEKKAAIASQKLANEHAKLSARSVKLEQDLERASAAARKSNDVQDAGVKRAGRLSSGFATLAKRAAAVGAAYLSIQGAKNAIAVTEDLGKATQGLVNNFGFATDEASRWAAQAKVRGIDTGKLSVSFNALTKNIAAVTAADKKRSRELGELGNSEKDQEKRAKLTTKSLGAQADAFKKLGIDTKTVKGGAKDFGGFLYEVADGMEGMTSKTERNAVGLKLFGKQWQTLRPLLSGGSDALREQMEMADKYGLTLGEADTEGLADMLKAQREWKFALLGVQVQLGKVLMPLMERFAAQLPVIADAVRKHWPEIKKEIAPVVDVVKDVVSAGAELVEEHPGLIKVAGAFVAVGLGLKAISFAGQITGVSRLIGSLGRLRTAAEKTTPTVAGVAGDGAGGTPMAGTNRRGRVLGRIKTAGKVGAVGAAAGVAGMVASGGDTSVGGMVSGALSGAAIGAVAGPWGAAVGAAVGGLSPVIVKKLPEIKAAASRIGQTIGDEVSKVPDWVQKNAPAVATVGRFLGGTLGKAFDGIKTSFGGLKKIVVSGVKGDLGGVFDGLKDMAVGGVKTMTAPLREIGERVLNAIKPPLRKAVNWIKGVPGDAADAIKPLPGKVAGAISGLAGRIKSKAEDAVDAGVSKLRGLVSRGASAVKGTAGKVAGAIAGLPGSLAGVATRGVTRFARGLGDLKDRAVGVVKKVPGAIRDGMGDIAGALSGVGKSIVNGIVSGIKSAPGAVVDAVKSLVPGPLRKVIPGLRRGGEIRVQRRRAGGLIAAAAAAGSLMLPAFASGGLVPALVSSGEEIEYGGRSMIVPGPRVAADNVFAMLPERAKVWTEHSQDLRAAGLPVDVNNQVPHFRAGGTIPRFKKGGTTTRTAKVGFSVYDDPPPGAFGALSNGYAELGTATRGGKGTGRGWLAKSLGLSGELKADQPLSVRINGHEKTLRKRDRGYGQGGDGTTSDPHYALDVWKDSWRTFGLSRNSKGTATVALGSKAPAGATSSTSEDSTTVSVPRILGRSTTRARDAMSTALTAGLDRGANWSRQQTAALGNPYLQSVREQLDEASSTYNRDVELKYRTATTAAEKAAVKAAGKAAGPVTPRVAKMISWADAASKKWPRYSYAGGHAKLGQGTGGEKGPGFDCSGFVSGILAAGKFTRSVMSTDGLKGWGQSGDGRQITVGVRGSTARAAHTMIQLGKTFWEAGSRGVGRRSTWSGSFPIHRHPKGYRAGGLVLPSAPAAVKRAMARPRPFDPASSDFVGWGYRRGGAVRRFRAGGNTGALGISTPSAPKGRSGRAVSAVLRSASDVNLDALDQQIAGLATSRLDALRQYLAARVDAGGDAKTVARIQAALSQVTEQIGYRVARSAQDVASKLESATATVDAVGDSLATGGIDADSIQGRRATITATRSAEAQARRAEQEARRDVDVATKNTAGLSPADRKAAIDVAEEQLDAATKATQGFGRAAIAAANDLARERPKLEAAARDQVVDMHAAVAQLSASPVDDRESIIERRNEAARQYDEANRRKDIGWITSSAQALAQATSDLNAFDQSMQEAIRAAKEQARADRDEQLDLGSALAGLTDSTEDDAAADRAREAELAARLEQAKADNDVALQITTANALKGVRDALKALDTTLQEQQAQTEALTDLMKQTAEQQQRILSGQAVNAPALAAALWAVAAGGIGSSVVRAGGTPAYAGGGARL